MNRVKAYVIETRFPFLIVSVFPVLLATFYIISKSISLNITDTLLVLAGVVCLHLGTNIINDYFDFKNGTDIVNKQYVPGFSGGSRIIQENLLAPNEVLWFSIFFFSLASIAGVYLTLKSGYVVLALGIFAIISGVLYSYFANSFYFGEVLVGVCFGILIPQGAYFVQTGACSADLLLLSMPFFALTFLIHLINEFPDYSADKQSGKKTLTVRIGPRVSALVYVITLFALYGYIVFISVNKAMPYLLLVILLMPLSLKKAHFLIKRSDNFRAIAYFSPMTVALYASISVIILCGVLWELKMHLLNYFILPIIGLLMVFMVYRNWYNNGQKYS
ncbi:MAG: prenyltransferase [Endomicrobiales bacterium]|nr:prenyltransferase [Endomicrobiales bacterium]